MVFLKHCVTVDYGSREVRYVGILLESPTVFADEKLFQGLMLSKLLDMLTVRSGRVRWGPGGLRKRGVICSHVRNPEKFHRFIPLYAVGRFHKRQFTDEKFRMSIIRKRITRKCSESQEKHIISSRSTVVYFGVTSRADGFPFSAKTRRSRRSPLFSTKRFGQSDTVWLAKTARPVTIRGWKGIGPDWIAARNGFCNRSETTDVHCGLFFSRMKYHR